MDEQRKYQVIKKLVETNGKKERAALTLGITVRQVNRLIAAYREKGKEAFTHGNRGRKPVTTIPDKTRQDVIDLYRTKYEETNFEHYTELLERQEGISISVSSVASILESACILSPKATRRKKRQLKKRLEMEKAAARSKRQKTRIQENLVSLEDAHPRRPRCAYFGELIQMDASPYEWFGPSKTTLHIAVDDASGCLVAAFFDQQETLKGYYHLYYQILVRYGIPYKFFTDRRSVFTYRNKRQANISEDTCTQFAYACRQLGTQLEYSSVPQAKGRVERMLETLQSRLPVELRLAGVTDIRAANEFLNSYIDEFNSRFALPLDGIKSVFEKQPEEDEINRILAVLTQRTVDSRHCIQFQKHYYRMMDSRGLPALYLKGTKVMVIQAFDGCLYCTVNDKKVYELEEVPFRQKSSKELDSNYTEPKPRKHNIPPMNHPWRRSSFWKFVKTQEHHLFDEAEEYKKNVYTDAI